MAGRVEITGDALAVLTQMGTRSHGVFLKALRRATNKVVRDAKSSVRRLLNRYPMGNLSRSITGDVNAQGLDARIGPRRVVYAAIHEFGGTIVPVRAERLAWYSKRDGHWYTTMKVTIPARPYLQPALDSNEQFISDTFADAIEELL